MRLVRCTLLLLAMLPVGCNTDWLDVLLPAEESEPIDTEHHLLRAPEVASECLDTGLDLSRCTRLHEFVGIDCNAPGFDPYVPTAVCHPFSPNDGVGESIDRICEVVG